MATADGTDRLNLEEETALAKKLGLGNLGCILRNPGLYIGDRYSAMRKEILKGQNIGHILNVSSSPDFLPEDFVYLSLRVDDHSGAADKLRSYFDEAFAFIEKARNEGSGVLVHCDAGRSRSATLCIQYLMRIQNCTVDHAYRQVKKARPIVMPNYGFYTQLCKLDEELHGKNASAQLTYEDYIQYSLSLEWKNLPRKNVCILL